LMRPDYISAGYGSSHACSVCDLPIERAKIEYEVLTPDKLRKLIFHFTCYVIWQRECSRLMGEPSQSPEEPHETPGRVTPDWWRFTAHSILRFGLVDG